MTVLFVTLSAFAYLAIGYGLATALWSVWRTADPCRPIAKFLFPITSRFGPEAMGVCKDSDARLGTLADVASAAPHEGLESYMLTTTVIWPFKAAWIAACNLVILAVGLCYLLIVGPTRLVQRLYAQKPKPRTERPAP